MNVSIICPVFNTNPDQLRTATASVLAQVGQHAIEVILVDDCSTSAATLEALRAIAAADARVQAVFQNRNAGPAAARTAGIARAAHSWIGFIDSDDLWPMDKLEHAAVVQAMWPDTRWISGNYTTLVPDGTLHDSIHLSTALESRDPTQAAHRIQAPLLTRILIGGWLPLGASLFRKDLLAQAGGFDVRLMYGEDWLLCMRLSTLAPMDYSETRAYVLRRQGSSMMRSFDRMSAKFAHSGRMARRDPLLGSVRRELRWFYYATLKDIAMNNALNGRKLRGLFYALRALLVDPREVSDMLLFMRNLPARGTVLAQGLRPYSTAEQVILAHISDAAPPQAR